MKKLIIASMLLGLGAQVAHASKSRLIALGQNKDGSLFLEDSRNHLRNASYVYNVANMAFFDFGSNGNAVTGLDTDIAQKAEGGVFYKAGSLVYGVYLGNENDTGVILKGLAQDGAATAMPQSDNVLELSVAGSASVNWGATVGWAPSKDEQVTPKKENKSLYARIGVNQNAWEAYLNASIQGESDNGAGQKYDGGGAYDVGGSYALGQNTFFGRYKTVDWDQINAGTTTKGDYMEYRLGVGHLYEVSSTSRIIYEISYDAAEANLKKAAAANAKYSQVPIVIGYEADATSWLTLRGSISQNLTGKSEVKNISSVGGALNQTILSGTFKSPNTTTDYKGSIKNSTNVNAGATLNFGKLSIDGLIGTGGTNGTGVATNAETGSLSLDRLMTRVSATYMF